MARRQVTSLDVIFLLRFEVSLGFLPLSYSNVVYAVVVCRSAKKEKRSPRLLDMISESGIKSFPTGFSLSLSLLLVGEYGNSGYGISIHCVQN